MQDPAGSPTHAARAFKQAIYQVHSPEGLLDLHIGKVSLPLREHMAHHGVRHAALLTAYNPQAQLTATAMNRQAQISLLKTVEDLHLPWWPGVNLDPQQKWPDEPSLLILGMSVEQARWLARRFRQLAFVGIPASGVPKLHFVQQRLPIFGEKSALLPRADTSHHLAGPDLKH